MANDRSNPFESTQPARGYFVGRHAELEDMGVYLDTVATGGATNLYIVGDEKGGDGKTSFLYKIREEATPYGLITAIVTLSKGMEADEIIFQLIDDALDELKDKYDASEYSSDFHKGAASTSFQIPVSRDKNIPLTPRDVEKDLKSLLRIFEKIGIKGCVLCVDEAQQLLYADGGAMIAKFRGAIQAIGNGFMIVLAATGDVVPTMAEGNPGVDRFFPNSIVLGPFENESIGILAIQKRLENNVILFPQAVSEEVVRIAELYPKTIIDVCHDIYAKTLALGRTQPDTQMIRDAVYTRYSEDVKHLIEVLGTLNPSQKSTLRKILSVGGTCTSKQIARLYCHSEDEECIERMEPIVHQELMSFVDRRVCEVEISQHEETFRTVSGRLQFILRTELAL